MALQIDIAARREFKSRDLWEMHALRAKVFQGRLGWEVPVLSGMEIDGYDALEPHYMMMRDSRGGILRGCWRLLPTEGPYMLKDSFPQLLHGQQAPSDEHIWELSRFAIETGGSNHFGFSQMTMESFAAILRFGHERGIERYVTVTTTAIERLLRRGGIVTERLGPPLVIGVETAVALFVDIEATCEVLFDHRLAS
ncbi:acyl-homoserine-lactone synthase [Massilia sp. Dwa41.01b]|uniref:acyl-homoserine-lactone synthase n=1 Tax=unclassified Massilia TaxID=2609279 RepID=UPI0016010036|nr:MULTISPECIES: acyl-homoserine-lactone synthase [unclassified Massilia]QNA89461.1 acyl-homoserine-lactone synthase [Massilia sp. Dwa41.01b]QNB00365.1 acyl-homoserine-lactone synthase [Massilia sp. Se16.2.3]